MRPEWVQSIQRQCRAQRVPFFFKQWGGVHKRKTGRELAGKTWDEFPSLRPPLATYSRGKTRLVCVE